MVNMSKTKIGSFFNCLNALNDIAYISLKEKDMVRQGKRSNIELF